MAIISLSGRISSGKDTVGSIAQFLLHTEGLWDQKTFDIYQTRPSKGVASNWQNYWEIKKFAGKLKQVATLLTGVPLEKWENQAFKESKMPRQWDYLKQMFENDENGEDGYATMPMTYRLFLQRLGTEAMRNGLHTNVWVNALFTDYNEVASKWDTDGITTVYKYPNWLITDMRFPNEFAAVKERGGLCVRVERDLPCSVCRLTRADRRGKPCYDSTCPLGRPNRGLHESETALDSYNFDYVIDNSGTIEDLVVEVQKMLSHLKLIS